MKCLAVMDGRSWGPNQSNEGQSNEGQSNEGRPAFLEADTQVSPVPHRSLVPHRCVAPCTDNTAVTGPPAAMKPARTPRSRTSTVKPWQRSRLKPVRDEDTTTIRPNPLAPIPTPTRKSGDKVNRLKDLLRQHRGDFELARRGGPAPRAPSGQSPTPEAARLVRQHKADFSTRDDLTARPKERPRSARNKERPRPPPLPARCKTPATDSVDHRPWLRRLEPTATPPPPAAPEQVVDTEPGMAPVPEPRQLVDTEPRQVVDTEPRQVLDTEPRQVVDTEPSMAPVVQPLPAPTVERHPLDFVARAADDPELPWSHRSPGQSRQVRTAPPTVRVEPLEFSDSGLFLAPRVSRRRRQAALATVLGLLGTLAVVAAVFLLGIPTAETGGTIELQSVPPGATVKLNGTISGTTPLVLNVTDLRQEYEVTLILESYQVWQDDLDFSGGDPRISVVATLSPRKAPPKDPAQ